LAQRPLPEGVRVVDFGIRGLDLTYALLDGYEAVILVDAAPRGEPPGTLSLLDLEGAELPAEGEAGPLIEGHGMDPVKVLRLAASMGGRIDRLLLVGCEPAPLAEADEMQMGLSEPVRRVVDKAVSLVEELAARLLRGELIEHHSWKKEGEPCRD
jgi:hydrogenase maturation protease